MARLPLVSTYSVLDTSWLLELYGVPRKSRSDRRATVIEQARAARGRMVVTLPVLFELAGHLVHVHSGRQRHALVERYRDEVGRSIAQNTPWTVMPRRGNGILLKAQDLVALAKRFAAESAFGYSLADLSILDLVEQLRTRGHGVDILTFDDQLASHAG